SGARTGARAAKEATVERAAAIATATATATTRRDHTHQHDAESAKSHGSLRFCSANRDAVQKSSAPLARPGSSLDASFGSCERERMTKTDPSPAATAPRFDLKGQIALVTGAARGLGNACAL